jgi:hypothetical protein
MQHRVNSFASQGEDWEAEGVAALAAQLKEDGVAFVPPPGEEPEDTLRRFLNARQGDILKAAAFLKEDAAWRAAQAIDELRGQDAAAVLGCDPAILRRVLPAAFGAGCDREGHPLVFKHFGAQCKLKSLLEHTSVQHLARYNAWLNEQLTLCLRDAAASRWTIVIDALGWHIGLFDSTAFSVLKQVRVHPSPAPKQVRAHPSPKPKPKPKQVRVTLALSLSLSLSLSLTPTLTPTLSPTPSQNPNPGPNLRR